MFAVFLVSCFASLIETNAKSASALTIDDCSYPDDAAAQVTWKAMEDSPPVLTTKLEGYNALQLRCNFSTSTAKRAYWNKSVKLNLASCDGIQFRIFCRDTRPVAYFCIYFQSGKGWYHSDFYPESVGAWDTISIHKAAMKTEGQPDGWDKVKTIRIAAWCGQKTNTEFFLSDVLQINRSDTGSPRQIFESNLAHIGKFAGYTNFDDAFAQISKQGRNNESTAKCLASAKDMVIAAQKLGAENKYDQAQIKISTADKELKNAYCLTQKPLPGEFRAFWCHSAYGVAGMSWDEAIHRLADNGFTAIIPNMLSAGVAYYPSKVLPVAITLAERGDQISQCLAACRKYGIAIHVWKLNWNLNGAPKEFVDQMRAEHRLQISDQGKEQLWLCPSRPENQKLEIDAMLELVRNYDLDGIHFDYIRYPDGDYCFCDGCKERFQRAIGISPQIWPKDVLTGGPLNQQWLDWRRSNITTVVKAVSEQARVIKPKIKISAAVFRYWNVDRDGVGQDWKLWCDKGWLDFVCPMDYTPSKARFENMVSQQVKWAGKVPCYPGLGVSASSSRFGADRAIEEINLTRQYQTGGFVIFNYGVNEANELLPQLGSGITRTTK